MTTKDNGGAAFPFSPNDHSTARMTTSGMSLRDWFAGQALITLGDVNPHLPSDAGSLRKWPEPQELAARRAKWAYLQADAMLAARALTTGENDD